VQEGSLPCELCPEVRVIALSGRPEVRQKALTAAEEETAKGILQRGY
jgi:hypothetical protein